MERADGYPLALRVSVVRGWCQTSLPNPHPRRPRWQSGPERPACGAHGIASRVDHTIPAIGGEGDLVGGVRCIESDKGALVTVNALIGPLEKGELDKRGITT